MRKQHLLTTIALLVVIMAALPNLSALACDNVTDERLNNSPALDCGAPLVAYLLPADENGMGFIDIYGIGSGGSTLVLHLPSIWWELAPPARDKTQLAITGNPNNGQPIAVYLMRNGEVVIESSYADGKPYVIRYDPDGAVAIHHIAW